MPDIGLAAEAVEQVEPLLTFRNDKGEIEGVKYNQLSAVFVNAIRDQQRQIERQQEQIQQERQRAAEQQEQLSRELRALKATVCRLQPDADFCR
jgi:transcription initiation factor TFIID subunit TAF12